MRYMDVKLQNYHILKTLTYLESSQTFPYCLRQES